MTDDLLFICGGLEPGVDGVGDHVARLAAALAARGRRVALLAYADGLVAQPVRERRPGAGGEVACLRLPRQAAGAERLAAARAFLAEREPAAVSLHYVAFAFDDRGLPRAENARLAALLAGRRLHLMLHELWTGLDDAAPLRLRLLGRLQRPLLARFLRQLRPQAIDTSLPVFQRELARLGWAAGRLPIFANLPQEAGAEAGWLERELAARGLPAAALRFLAFGSIPENWPAEAVLGRIEAWAAEAGRPAAILCLGRNGAGTARLPAWRARHPALSFVELGPQSGERIADALQAVDYGLSAFPLWAAGKSGSTAAMLEVGLPTLVGFAGRADAGGSLPADVADLVVRADKAGSSLPPPRRESLQPRRIDRLGEVVRRYEAWLDEAESTAA